MAFVRLLRYFINLVTSFIVIYLVISQLQVSDQVTLRFTPLGRFVFNTSSSKMVDSLNRKQSCSSRLPCSALFCAKTCANYPVCAAFSFNSQNGKCLLHEQWWTASSKKINDSSWKTFNRNKEDFPVSCVDGKKFSPLGGVQLLLPPDQISPIRVYCDQTTDGGGWTVFQRRVDYLVDFDKTYQEYINSFGNFETSFWLGLENIHRLNQLKPYNLRVDIHDENRMHYFAVYTNFKLGSAATSYTLNVDPAPIGTGGDYLYSNNGNPFNTKDTVPQCSGVRKGGWWYDAPTTFLIFLDCKLGTNLNGNDQSSWGVAFVTFTELKFRPSV